MKNKTTIIRTNNKPKKSASRLNKTTIIKTTAKSTKGQKKSGRNSTGLVPRAMMLNNIKNAYTAYMQYLLNPRLSLISQPPKYPSDFNIPTNTIHIVDQHKVTANQNGDILITWRPNFLAHKPIINIVNRRLRPGWDANYQHTEQQTVYYWSNLTVNNDNSLNGQTISSQNNNHNNFQDCVLLDIPVSRYRILGAEMRITYMGPDDQAAGMYQGCVTYNDTLCVMGKRTTNWAGRAVDHGILEFENFSHIRNGLWAGTKPIAANDRSVRTLYIPSDTTDKEFHYIGEYYDAETDVDNYLDHPDHVCVFQRTESGAQMTHVVAISDAQPGAQFNIEIVTNYEVVADTNSNNIFAKGAEYNYEDKFNSQFKDLLNSSWNRAISDASIINTSQPVIKNVSDFNINMPPAFQSAFHNTINNLSQSAKQIASNVGRSILSGLNPMNIVHNIGKGAGVPSMIGFL